MVVYAANDASKDLAVLDDDSDEGVTCLSLQDGTVNGVEVQWRSYYCIMAAEWLKDFGGW